MDGIYLVLKNGDKVKFTGKNSEQETSDCKYIGLKMGSKAILIALRDGASFVTLTTKLDKTSYKGYKICWRRRFS